MSWRAAILIAAAAVSTAAAAWLWDGRNAVTQDAADPIHAEKGASVATGVSPTASPAAESAAQALVTARNGTSVPASPAPAVVMTPSQRRAYEQAAAIQAALRGPGGCRGASAQLLGLIRETTSLPTLQAWATDRALDCSHGPRSSRPDHAFLEELAALLPDNPKVRERLGEEAYDNGDAREAIRQLEEAVKEQGTFQAWETLADARLALAAELAGHGNVEGAQALWQQARDAALQALALAPPTVLPFAMHTLARAQLALGAPAEAVHWADQSLLALSSSEARLQTVLAPEVYLFAGQIYYRAGQRDTGVAYMDQGIGMAQSERQMADLRRLKEEFLRQQG